MSDTLSFTVIKEAFLELTDEELSGKPRDVARRVTRRIVQRLAETGFEIKRLANIDRRPSCPAEGPAG